MGRPQLFLVVEGALAQIWGLGLVQRTQLLPGPLHGLGQLRHSRGTQAIHRYCSSRSAMFSRNFSRLFFFSEDNLIQFWESNQSWSYNHGNVKAIRIEVWFWYGTNQKRCRHFFWMLDTLSTMSTFFCQQILKKILTPPPSQLPTCFMDDPYLQISLKPW